MTAEDDRPATGTAPAALLHDLRSASGTLLTWCHILQRGTLDAARAAHGLSVMEATIRRQLALMEQLGAAAMRTAADEGVDAPTGHADSAPGIGPAPAPSKAAAPAATSDLAGVRILIVDDDADAREAMRIILVAHGADVATAISAIDAFDVLQQGRPDLLISDIVMPDADGYALLRRIRAPDTGERGLMPAIAVTGYAGDRQRALGAGYQLQLTKPVAPADLITTVRNLLGR